MKTDEMRDEYDLSRAKRGMLYGEVERKKVSDSSDFEPKRKTHAVCVKAFDEKSLIIRKIYDVTFLGNDLVEVVDEQGGTEIYPANLFLQLSLPAEIENVLEQIAA